MALQSGSAYRLPVVPYSGSTPALTKRSSLSWSTLAFSAGEPSVQVALPPDELRRGSGERHDDRDHGSGDRSEAVRATDANSATPFPLGHRFLHHILDELIRYFVTVVIKKRCEVGPLFFRPNSPTVDDPTADDSGKAWPSAFCDDNRTPTYPGLRIATHSDAINSDGTPELLTLTGFTLHFPGRRREADQVTWLPQFEFDIPQNRQESGLGSGIFFRFDEGYVIGYRAIVLTDLRVPRFLQLRHLPRLLRGSRCARPPVSWPGLPIDATGRWRARQSDDAARALDTAPAGLGFRAAAGRAATARPSGRDTP